MKRGVEFTHHVLCYEIIILANAYTLYFQINWIRESFDDTPYWSGPGYSKNG